MTTQTARADEKLLPFSFRPASDVAAATRCNWMMGLT